MGPAARALCAPGPRPGTGGRCRGRGGRHRPTLSRQGDLLLQGLLLPWCEQLLDLMRPAPGMTVLDVGNDAGVLRQALRRRGAQVVAVDPEAARGAVRADPGQLPLRDGGVDAAGSLFGLVTLPGELEPALGELQRVVRPHGRIAVLGWLDAPHEQALAQAWEEVAGAIPQFLRLLLRRPQPVEGLRLDEVAGVVRFDGPAQAWAALVLQRPLRDALEEPARVEAGFRRALVPWQAADDTLRIPVRVWIAGR